MQPNYKIRPSYHYDFYIFKRYEITWIIFHIFKNKNSHILILYFKVKVENLK